MPGTKRFSLQLDVGPTLRLISSQREARTNNVTTTIEESAWRAELADMLSGGLLFTYYFGDVH